MAVRHTNKVLISIAWRSATLYAKQRATSHSTWRPPRCAPCPAPRRGARGGHHAQIGVAARATHYWAWRATTPLSCLPRGGLRLGGLCVALFATTIYSKPHFSLLTLFTLPLLYSSHYPLPSSTCQVPVGTCQVFRLRSRLRALNGILLVCLVVCVICVVGVC